MGQIVVSSFLSVDGVMEAPEKWSLPFWNDEIGSFKERELQESEAQLLGRTTYEGFATSWPGRSGDYADRFNEQAKYVVSDSLESADWNNSHILRRDDALASDLNEVKRRHTGDIVVHGSGTLARWLLSNRLVDRLHLLVYPLLLGKGRRLFEGLSDIELMLQDSRTLGSGVKLLVYQPAAA